MKALSKLFLTLGTLMILCAAALLLYNRWDNHQAQTLSEQILQQLEQQIPEESQILPTQAAGQEGGAMFSETDGPREMTVKTVEGLDYIGYLSIPALDLNLPVQSQWSYSGLRTSPGRFFGSVYTGDLVICAHNYASHFGKLTYLESGTRISFTDMDGQIWKYTLSQTETLSPDQLEDMVDRFRSSGDWEMTLFTCTPGGQARIALRFQAE